MSADEIDGLARALFDVCLLQYCDECSGQDDWHALDENGDCYRHEMPSKDIVLQRTRDAIGKWANRS